MAALPMIFAGFTQDIRFWRSPNPELARLLYSCGPLLAIGIAASTQIFALVDALLLRPLPVSNPQNLVQLFEQQANRPADTYFDYSFYRQLAGHSSTLFKVVGQIDTTRSLERGQCTGST